jgi:hypothetical protein
LLKAVVPVLGLVLEASQAAQGVMAIRQAAPGQASLLAAAAPVFWPVLESSQAASADWPAP